MKKFDLLKVSFIVRSDKKQSGVSPVLMMLSIDGRRAYISTGHKVQVSDWDSSNGKFIGGSAKIRTLNEFLDRMRMDVIRIYNEMNSKLEDITVDELRKALKGENERRSKTLVEVCKLYNSSFEKLIGIEIGEITFKRYATFASKVEDFMKLKMGIKDIRLENIKYSFGLEYDHYLKSEVKLHQNTLVKYIQYLNRVLDYAVKYEWLDKNVLFGYKCPVKETKREYLTTDELQRIVNKEIKVIRLQEVRDCFVFCCYTGYAYKDAANLTPDHIGTGINGSKWIYTSRQKNDNVSNVPLLDQAMEIIEKYADHPDCVSKNKLLPMKSNQKLNAYLKELADICEITKPMTMHIARHTFATTVLLSNGVSMEATSKMLGHSSLKTTQIYGKILETRVGSEMEMLKAKLSTGKKSDQKREAK
ncbi:MAG: tyrosine-type recombinase/integrase [Saprospiraceae bacterium]|jgi:site-specific recombinase XerD|nr:site-specific integrase [Saprospiraceae bacterium]